MSSFGLQESETAHGFARASSHSAAETVPKKPQTSQVPKTQVRIYVHMLEANLEDMIDSVSVPV